MFSFRLLYILFVFFLIGCDRDQREKMPDFRIMTANSQQVIQTGNIPEGRATMLIHFDSQCKDCQNEAEAIIDNMNHLEEVDIYFVSLEDNAHINLFHEYYKFDNYPNVTVGSDMDTAMVKHFQSRSTPLLALYDKNKKIKAVFEGKADMRKLLQLVDEIKHS